MNKTIAITLLTTSLLAGTAGTFAGEPAGRSLIESHLSIIPDGYDLVEATGSGKRVRGKLRYNHTHEGKIYIFANRTNRDLFVFDPDRYLPTP